VAADQTIGLMPELLRWPCGPTQQPKHHLHNFLKIPAAPFSILLLGQQPLSETATIEQEQ
jgi:hypothetical protein